MHMSYARKIYILIKKDIASEYRNLSFILSLLLFAVTTVFITVRTLGEIEQKVSAAILGLMLLFSTVNFGAKTFANESGRQRLFYYSLYNPNEVIIAKIIYNTLLNFIVFCLITILMYILGGIALHFIGTYILGGILTSLGLSIIFSFTSLISSHEETQNFSVLMSVVSLPLCIPIVMTMRRIVLGCISGQLEDINPDFLILVGINLFLMGIEIIIFRALWSE
jgi:heme exporter protein B